MLALSQQAGLRPALHRAAQRRRVVVRCQHDNGAAAKATVRFALPFQVRSEGLSEC